MIFVMRDDREAMRAAGRRSDQSDGYLPNGREVFSILVVGLMFGLLLVWITGGLGV